MAEHTLLEEFALSPQKPKCIRWASCPNKIGLQKQDCQNKQLQKAPKQSNKPVVQRPRMVLRPGAGCGAKLVGDVTAENEPGVEKLVGYGTWNCCPACTPPSGTVTRNSLPSTWAVNVYPAANVAGATTVTMFGAYEDIGGLLAGGGIEVPKGVAWAKTSSATVISGSSFCVMVIGWRKGNGYESKWFLSFHAVSLKFERLCCVVVLSFREKGLCIVARSNPTISIILSL